MEEQPVFDTTDWALSVALGPEELVFLVEPRYFFNVRMYFTRPEIWASVSLPL